MTTSELAALRNQLIAHEGLRLRPYTDTVGKLTIGVGRNLTDKGLSQPEVMQLLDHDIEEVMADLRSFGWFLKLDADRRLALCDLRFNLGPHRFRLFVRMLSAIERGDFSKAADELLLSAWATQVQPSRARLLVNQLRLGTVDGPARA